MPFGTRAPSASKWSGLRRKSTISCSSAFASSRPATSSHVTDDDEPGVISIGLTRGISLTVFQSSQTTTHMSRKKQTGSHVSAKFETKLLKSKPWVCAAAAAIGVSVIGLRWRGTTCVDLRRDAVVEQD